MTTSKLVYEAISKAWAGETLEALKEYVRVPAKSRNFDSQWEKNGLLLAVLNQAADWGRARFTLTSPAFL